MSRYNGKKPGLLTAGTTSSKKGNSMRALTEQIKEQINNGWKVGIERDNTMLVYDVIAKDGDAVVGKERWILHPKETGKPIEEVKKSLPRLTALSEAEIDALKKTQTAFALIPLDEIVSCLSAADGNIYTRAGMIDKYGDYE